jgi:hypothetical protein
VLVIVDLRFDPPRLRVLEGIAQRLAGNAVDFVPQEGALSRNLDYAALQSDGNRVGPIVRAEL